MLLYAFISSLSVTNAVPQTRNNDGKGRQHHAVVNDPLPIDRLPIHTWSIRVILYVSVP